MRFSSDIDLYIRLMSTGASIMRGGGMAISTAAIFFNFLWALLLVVGLAYGAARLLKRAGIGVHSPSRYIQQVDFLPMGPKRGIAIVQVVDKTLCVGVTDARIELLCELDPEALTRYGESLPTPTVGSFGPLTPGGKRFAEEVWRRLRQRGGPS